MAFSCNICQHTNVLRRNGQLQCARCGHPVVYYTTEDDINYEKMSHRAKAYLTAGDYDLAQVEYRRLNQLRPEDFMPYLGIAASVSRGYTQQNSSDQTIAHLIKARKLMPKGYALPKASKDYIEAQTQMVDTTVSKLEEAVHFNYTVALISFVLSLLMTFFSALFSFITFLISLVFIYRNMSLEGKNNELRRAKKVKDDFYQMINS
jgi:tetratricopeptide (TPR) repeat protein